MKRVFLVGYMGAGKTTVGKELAKLAGLSFIDLDFYIEGRYHKDLESWRIVLWACGECCRPGRGKYLWIR